MGNLGVVSAMVSVIFGLLLGGNTARADEPSASADPVVMPVELFFKEMQLFARRVPVGNKKLEQEDSLKKLREEIHVKFDGVILQYDARIESVDWRNELATIKTHSPIRKYKPSARLPFNITTTQPIVIPMSRGEAGALQTRKPLVFCGTLSFQDGKWGAVGRPPASQSIFWIRSENYKQVISIGTFITKDYSVSLGDEEIFAIHPEQEAE
ncbi:hypothetical protein RISK_005370 [Rhodopirellula islandica]|uniref:Uncharacterized protein n=1 Tax=Rhodopirellula islandica TaxID=595434 RepID=A0A0J1E9Z8_RHOIS|nr:hypothetical protein [Rhodopirellula islandica]KLU02304.1 hypothetical protein RISK_005370 [Rhodopirellula islandica]